MAATEVIIDHYFQHLKLPISHLATKILYLFPGVPVFFFISGYLISASFERNGNLRNYLRNRALRIYPGLWGCIILTVIVISITGVSFLNRQTIGWLPAQLAGFIYTPAFLANYGFGSYNGSLWTIPIELQFYLLLPVCYFFAPKRHINYWFAALFIAFTIISFMVQVNYPHGMVAKLIRYSFIQHFYLFLAGVMMQRLRVYTSRFIYNKAHYWLIIYVFFSMILFDRLDPIVFTMLQYLLLTFCLLSMAYTLPNLAAKMLRTNDISYGVYIYHGLILTVIVQLKLVGYINIYLILLLTYLLAYLSWMFIEKPFMKRKERTIRQTV